MNWSPAQEAALDAVGAWLRDRPKQVFRLFGFAGSGKSTLAMHLAQGARGRVEFCSYTGKAAHVMRQKGCTDASTIHKLIYHPREKSQARLRDLERELLQASEAGAPDERLGELRRALEEERGNVARPSFALNEMSRVREAALIVVDEVSMVDSRVGTDLLSFGVPVLVLGDPAQLPPVRGGGFFTDAEPDVMLEEVHRQALDNPVLAMATTVRQGGRLAVGEYGESRVIRRAALDPAEPLAADQLLVGKNATRHACNKRMRELVHGETGDLPVAGDKLVCTRNNHELGLLNGSLWRATDVMPGAQDDQVIMTIESLEEDREALDVEAWTDPLRGLECTLPYWARKEAQEFEFGYAMTVHKAQGSQWNDVVVIDEGAVFRENARRWLYTAITRAAERVTVAR